MYITKQMFWRADTGVAVVQGKRVELSCDPLILGAGYCILSGFPPHEGCN